MSAPDEDMVVLIELADECVVDAGVDDLLAELGLAS